MFHVGDIIIGNRYASEHYAVTGTGTEWEVIDVLPDGMIRVNPGRWTVDGQYFDLKERGLDESNVDGSELDNMFGEFE